jgi:hypothetical protein
MTSTKSIYDTALPAEDGKPVRLALGDHVFPVQWKVYRPNGRVEEESGFYPAWQASAEVAGRVVSGNADLPLVSLASLAGQLNRDLHLGQESFGIELPLSEMTVRSVCTSRG